MNDEDNKKLEIMAENGLPKLAGIIKRLSTCGKDIRVFHKDNIGDNYNYTTVSLSNEKIQLEMTDLGNGRIGLAERLIVDDALKMDKVKVIIDVSKIAAISIVTTEVVYMGSDIIIYKEEAKDEELS